MKEVARPDITPAFAERNVPVALATDENYLPYVKVAINSAIASSPGSNLDFIVLHAGITEDAIRTFVAGYAGAGHATVRFVGISEELEAFGLSGYKQTARLPLSACYRLLLPSVLAAYDKVVYLDVDVAVCRDLGELYATDVGDNYFAAAKDVVYTTKPEYVSWAAKWGFEEWSGYVNTGVLVMNLERFRREPVFDRLKEIVFEAAKWNCDQDALNFVCKGAIAPLDPRWNVQLGDYCILKQIAQIGDEMWIAHYTARQKPWTYPARRYSHLWWRHAAEPDVLRLWADAWGEALVQPVAGVPKVSIIIPVYNSARYLPEALASVLMQKELPEIEVICIDDGSTDDSAAILDFWEKRDSRLKVLRQANAGPGVARNVGLDIARGEYICFLDADDRLSSGAVLRAAHEQAKSDDLDILIAASAVMAEDGKVEKRDAYLNRSLLPATRVFVPEALATGLYLVAPMTPWAKLFRRKFLEEKQLRFPPLKRSEDFPFVQLALSLAGRIGVVSQSIVDHRVEVATSLETTKDETPLIFIEAERIFREGMARRGLLSKYRDAVNMAFVIRLAYNLRAVRKFASYKAILGAMRESFESWTACDSGGEVTGAYQEAKAYLDDVFKANVPESDLVQRFIDERILNTGEKIRVDVWRKYDSVLKELNGARKLLRERWSQLDEAQKSRSKAWAQHDKVFAELKAARRLLRKRWSQLDEAQKSRSKAWAQHDKVFAELKEARRLLKIRWEQVDSMNHEIKVKSEEKARLESNLAKLNETLQVATSQNAAKMKCWDQLCEIVAE